MSSDARKKLSAAYIDSLGGFDAIAVNKRFIRSGKIVTAAGVSAGIDMALWLAGQIAGAELRNGFSWGSSTMRNCRSTAGVGVPKKLQSKSGCCREQTERQLIAERP